MAINAQPAGTAVSVCHVPVPDGHLRTAGAEKRLVVAVLLPWNHLQESILQSIASQNATSPPSAQYDRWAFVSRGHSKSLLPHTPGVGEKTVHGVPDADRGTTDCHTVLGRRSTPRGRGCGPSGPIGPDPTPKTPGPAPRLIRRVCDAVGETRLPGPSRPARTGASAPHRHFREITDPARPTKAPSGSMIIQTR